MRSRISLMLQPFFVGHKCFQPKRRVTSPQQHDWPVLLRQASDVPLHSLVSLPQKWSSEALFLEKHSKDPGACMEIAHDEFGA